MKVFATDRSIEGFNRFSLDAMLANYLDKPTFFGSRHFYFRTIFFTLK